MTKFSTMVEVSYKPTQNFTSENRSFLNYFRLVGLIPFKLDTKFSRSFHNELKTIILFIFHLTIFGYSVAIAEIHDTVGGVTWFAVAGNWIAINVSCIVNLLEVYRGRNTQRKLLEVFNQIDEFLLVSLKVDTDGVKKNKTLRYGAIVALIGLSFILVGVNITSWRQFLRFTLVLYLPCFTLYNRTIQVFFYLDATADKIRLCSLKVTGLSADRDPMVLLPKETLQNIKHFVLIFFKLNEEINDTFGWGMVFIFLQHFVGIICNTYLIFDALNGYDRGGAILENVALQIPTVIFLLTIPYKAAQCNKLLQELISQLHYRANFRDVDCSNVVSDLTVFASRPGFHVSAKGFFDIEPQMVLSMFAAIFTYLIILIQFKQQEESKSKKGNT